MLSRCCSAMRSVVSAHSKRSMSACGLSLTRSWPCSDGSACLTVQHAVAEQATDRWCSHTTWGQEFWQILAQWVWNLRGELGHALHPTPMRATEFAAAQMGEPAEPAPDPTSRPPEPAPVAYGPPQWARPSYTKGFAGSDFSLSYVTGSSPLHSSSRCATRGK